MRLLAISVLVVAIFSMTRDHTAMGGGIWRRHQRSTNIRAIVWGGFGSTVGGTGIAIGTGKSNTERIVAKFGDVEPYEKRVDYAAKLCADLVVTKDGVTYDDWFLPSKDELDLMYENLWRKGSFADRHRYWSSSELDEFTAYQRTFIKGESMPFEIRYTECNVRPVRAF